MAYYLLSIEPVIVDDSWDLDRDAFHLEYCHIWFQLMCLLNFALLNLLIISIFPRCR